MTGLGLRVGIERLWRGRGGSFGRVLLSLLWPVELVFRAGVWSRNRWYDRRRPTLNPLPVVSVGNLSVGGTGKTPILRWLGDWLRQRGAAVAVVTRGYGADEVALYRRWFGPDAVFVSPERSEGARVAKARGFSIALIDDGFQHRRCGRDLDVLLVAAEGPAPVRLLPRGPYREPVRSARRASHVLITRRVAGRDQTDRWRRCLATAAPHVPTSVVDLSMEGWSDLTGDDVAPPQGDVLAVCSVAAPEAFCSGLEHLLPGVEVELAAFTDHYAYTDRDVMGLLDRRRGRAIVTTAKDAVKLKRFEHLTPHVVVAGLVVVGEPPEPLREALSQLLSG